MLTAVLVLGGLGCLAALGLGAASRRFWVRVDPRVEELERVLPGVNCGACGYAGCNALARGLAEGKAAANACIPGGPDVAAAVARILGVDAGATVKQIAVVHCKGARGVALDKGVYFGVPDCRAATLVGGGPKRCNYGCMGLGSCQRWCPFDAIHVGADGLAHVDRKKCTGCGNCVPACPKNIIDLMPANELVYVRCNSPLKGKAVKSVCEQGCIGCRRCEKACPFDAITMNRDLAKIDPEKCTSCGLCATVCPTSNIDDVVDIRYHVRIDDRTCVGCTRCVELCPVEAITDDPKEPRTVDANQCISCYQCLEACPVGAIEKGAPREPAENGKAA